jgi:hypothetical protein
LLGGVRTPFARYGSSLSHIRLDDLLGDEHEGSPPSGAVRRPTHPAKVFASDRHHTGGCVDEVVARHGAEMLTDPRRKLDLLGAVSTRQPQAALNT